MSRFMIGAGRQRRSGWKTVDADRRVRPDIVATLPPVPEECREAEAFELIHVLEHFHLWEARDLLRGFLEALRPGGELILELPNLESAIETLSGRNGRNRDQWGMWVLYGDPRRKNPLFGHKWAWTPATLEAELLEAGFGSVRRERPRHHVPARDFRLVGVKGGKPD